MLIFSRGGAGRNKAENLWGGCSKGNFNLHKVKLIYLTFIILIVITISITIIIIISIITSIIAIIINSTKDDILDMEELFHTLTNF